MLSFRGGGGAWGGGGGGGSSSPIKPFPLFALLVSQLL